LLRDSASSGAERLHAAKRGDRNLAGNCRHPDHRSAHRGPLVRGLTLRRRGHNFAARAQGVFADAMKRVHANS
jgi:hypothetical protein